MILTLGWTACSQAPVQEKATPTPPGFITPYWTRTPTQEITPAALSARTPTPIPTPTPTPVSHRVIEGETMLGIALRYGISLEELMVANPEVDPRFLSIDTELVIPLGESAPPDFVMPTPIPVGLGVLTCYPTADGGAWCFWPVDNQHTRSLENLSARIILYSIEGDALVESLAIPPLNLIPGGQSLPLVAFFPPPLPDEFFPQGELLTALPVRQQDERYLEARLEVIEVAIDPSGLIATLHGTISLPEDSAPAGLVWLAAVAYGEDGRVAGLRKWEAGEVPLEAGERSSFELDLFSLGPPIQEVEVLIEARP